MSFLLKIRQDDFKIRPMTLRHGQAKKSLLLVSVLKALSDSII